MATEKSAVASISQREYPVGTALGLYYNNRSWHKQMFLALIWDGMASYMIPCSFMSFFRQPLRAGPCEQA